MSFWQLALWHQIVFNHLNDTQKGSLYISSFPLEHSAKYFFPSTNSKDGWTVYTALFAIRKSDRRSEQTRCSSWHFFVQCELRILHPILRVDNVNVKLILFSYKEKVSLIHYHYPWHSVCILHSGWLGDLVDVFPPENVLCRCHCLINFMPLWSRCNVDHSSIMCRSTGFCRLNRF